MLSASQVIDLIDMGENSRAELKEISIQNGKVLTPHRDGITDELAAFANSSGGTIIFGVSDKERHIIGIESSDASAFVDWITEICCDSVKPPIVNFEVNSVYVPNDVGERKCVPYVQVAQSLWLHKSANGYFYRLGNRKIEMSPEYLLHIAQTRSQAQIISFDEQAIPNTSESTLQRDLYMRFVREDSIEALARRRILVKTEDEINVSVSGILMCTQTPDEYIYNSFIQAVFYGSTKRDANYQINALDCRGPLDQQIIQAYNFVRQHNFVSAKKESWRMEKPQYSMRAVFEALVNAVVHRDYSIYGSKIRLFMYSDRIEIISPGTLANTLTVENLMENQVTRNEMLARLLSELSVEGGMSTTVDRSYFLERRGEGVRIIYDESERLSGQKPVYQIIGEELKLTIIAAPSLQDG